MLKHSKGKIRFAILIKLVTITAGETNKNKRRSPNFGFSSCSITKRVRTVVAGYEGVEIAARHDSIDGGPGEGVDAKCSDLSSLASDDSIESSIRETDAIVDVETKPTDSFPVEEVSSSSSDLSNVNSNKSRNSLILETHPIEDLETMSTTPFTENEASSALSSVDWSHSIYSPRRSLDIVPRAIGFNAEPETLPESGTTSAPSVQGQSADPLLSPCSLPHCYPGPDAIHVRIRGHAWPAMRGKRFTRTCTICWRCF